jgi:hypothetical protein
MPYPASSRAAGSKNLPIPLPQGLKFRVQSLSVLPFIPFHKKTATLQKTMLRLSDNSEKFLPHVNMYEWSELSLNIMPKPVFTGVL